jgi:glutamate racemase
MLEKNIDTVVLGCTHYPFVIPLIEQIVGENVRVIDPAPSVARQTQRLLEAENLLNRSGALGRVQYFTSGDVPAVQSALVKLLGRNDVVHKVKWVNEQRLVPL